MLHAFSMPAPGFQAIILCGPGSSFPTFTSNPEENPKALLPVANRPMVWYPTEFCYRMGITNITLIVPNSSLSAMTVALNTNPHLTSLPLPKPNILAPDGLDQNTGTAAIFRLPQVREVIKGDFIILPCDLICELGGESLIELWMMRETNIGSLAKSRGELSTHLAECLRKQGRKGGLGVWYETKGESAIKDEETDFIATSPLKVGSVPVLKSSLLNHTSKLVYSLPTDTLNDLLEEEKSFPIRHSLIRTHKQIRMFSSHRDAHIYVFPAWIVDIINKNEHMDSIGEDLVGWWAKAGWQAGLGEKLGFGEVFERLESSSSDEDYCNNSSRPDDVDCGSLSTTWTSELQGTEISNSSACLVVPPILAYIPPPSNKLIRRVDTAPLLRAVSLQLAKIESIDMVGKDGCSPFAHQAKIAYPEGIASRTTITKLDCLIAENVTVEEKSSIKECVIGANCQIRSGARLLRCVLMDGVVVERGCRLTGCILGKRCAIGEDSTLQDCEVQENLLVEAGTEDKNNRLMSSDGMKATEEEMQAAFTDNPV
ncbi:putative translation initiation factor eIF-2B subunit gamma [Golovinomyces cichoracearum]|uniref:Translation initiation factor eIF2B subunit gamma n=1 Tax=Golovinomyces cichoracearum TaxID=62708 RepID=A0A420IZ12_9PEZI|nr:putative translation initiation factor eIF-2B subunit gamma [Golovinomyces cichoracearum]